MPDTKLSALTAVTNPVVGTDTLYLVRAGASYKTTVADLPASGGDVATDAIWNAAGDLVQGTGANTAARLAIGTAGQYLKVNAGATAAEWAAVAGGGDMVLADVQTVTGAKTFGGAGAVGKLKIAGTTSGSTILDATAVAGAGTVTLPTTGTLATLAGSENLSNKTFTTGNALGTPDSGTLTSCTGLPAAGVVGTALVAAAIGTTVQAYDADLTTYAGITPSANIQTFLGAADYAAMKTQLALTIGTNVQAYDADLTTWAGVTPGTGVATALAVNNNAAGGYSPIDGTATLTNKRITKRVVTASDATSITPNSDNADITYQANTQAVGTLTIAADGGTPTNGQPWVLKLKSTNIQTFSWNAIFAGGTVALPTASSGSSKFDYYSFIYDSATPKWHFVGNALGF